MDNDARAPPAVLSSGLPRIPANTTAVSKFFYKFIPVAFPLVPYASSAARVPLLNDFKALLTR
jgi:hypothetical protein